MPVKAGYLFLAGGGAVVIWSGVKGKRATDVFRTLIGGNSPANLPQAYNVTGVVPTAGAPGANPGSNPTIAFQGGTGPGPNSGTVPNAPSVSGTYNHAQLMQLWQAAGGSSNTANNAACHAMQESSGVPGVTSANPDGGTNVGLWQLDTRGKGAGYSIAMLQNPLINARVAVLGSRNGTDWSAWATPGC